MIYIIESLIDLSEIYSTVLYAKLLDTDSVSILNRSDIYKIDFKYISVQEMVTPISRFTLWFGLITEHISTDLNSSTGVHIPKTDFDLFKSLEPNR